MPTKRKDGSKRKNNSKSLLTEEEVFSHGSTGFEEIGSDIYRNEIREPLSRTSLLIQDYLQFKAARTIQRHVRGWLYRLQLQRKRLAAIKIQAEWRRFYYQRKYYRQVEETVQQAIEKHHYRSAQKIQALWRGWWVRQHVHNHARLKNYQLLQGEDLLYCVAFKLHHLLRTHQIPGVYSLRNSSAFSKIEELLASLKFRTYTYRTRFAKEKDCKKVETARKKHGKSGFGTKVPFPAKDVNNICLPRCLPLYNTKDADIRMCKILQMYEEASRKRERPKVLKKKSALFRKASYLIRSSESSGSFCGDVVNSMKRWKIITENNIQVDPNVFQNPQNVENFLKEIESKLSLLQGNSYSGREFLEDLNKVKAKYLPDNRRSDQSDTK